mmetsp:Transcript_38625/g.57959  ORF Transcript_38625/g.57959 Transcript_38625/m.57959 type:complete len:112 (-) Transcript_38625:14-349(-)
MKRRMPQTNVVKKKKKSLSICLVSWKRMLLPCHDWMHHYEMLMKLEALYIFLYNLESLSSFVRVSLPFILLLYTVDLTTYCTALSLSLSVRRKNKNDLIGTPEKDICKTMM